MAVVVLPSGDVLLSGGSVLDTRVLGLQVNTAVSLGCNQSLMKWVTDTSSISQALIGAYQLSSVIIRAFIYVNAAKTSWVTFTAAIMLLCISYCWQTATCSLEVHFITLDKGFKTWSLIASFSGFQMSPSGPPRWSILLLNPSFQHSEQQMWTFWVFHGKLFENLCYTLLL